MDKRENFTKGLILLGLFWFASAAGAARHLYVDPAGGSDNWDGTAPTYQSDAIGPKKTLSAAQIAVRQWIVSGLSEDVYVELRSGRYELTSVLIFTPADSHPTYAVTWRNFNGEDVRLSGGKAIAASWTYDAAKGYYKTRIPEVAAGTWWFRDLYRDDQRLTRSRWPNAPTDTMKMAWSPDRLPSDSNLLTLSSVNSAKTELVFDASPPRALRSDDKAEVVLFRLWTSLRTVIDHSRDAALYLAEPMTGCLVIQPGEQYTRKGFLENATSFIDQDNEWALDTNGYLYYRGPNPETSVFIAPGIHTLISVEGGGVSNRVRNLHFVGLTLEHANFVFPNGGLNWYPRQAGVPCDYVHIPAAVRFNYTQNCSLQQCNIVRCSGVGIHLDTGSWADRIERCTVSDIGNTGIILGNAAEEYVSPTRTAYGRVENNRVSRCGQGDFGAVGIGEMFMRGALIRHNEIFDLPYTGISLGWHWWSSTTNPNAQNIEVSYNHIYQVCQMMDDGAGIYTLDDLTGTQILHNLVQRVGWSGQTCSGIYTDEGSKNYTVFGNVVDTVYDGWCHFLHYENFNGIIQNNIYINGQRREIYAAMREGFSDYFANFSKNILFQKAETDSYLSYVGSWNNSSQYDTDYNCYYHPLNLTKTFADLSWSGWKSKGNDLNSYYQQAPMFEDTMHADKNYRLRDDSPLLAAPLYFQQVQVQHAGVLPIVPPMAGDIEVDGKIDLLDMAKLSRFWLNRYTMPTLLELAEAWLTRSP